MTETSGFSHITVHSDDDDEVVIQAGARPNARHDEQSPAQSENSQPVAAPEPLEPQEQTHPVKSQEQSRPADPQPAPKVAGAPVKKPAKKGSYQQTTAEDLETGPMPTAQKVVIVMAVLFIVGFLVYYNFLR